DLSGVDFDEDNPFDPNGEFKLTVEWKLEDGHGWIEGHEITITLPEQIKYDAGTSFDLPTKGGEVVARVTFGETNEATLVFTDFIEHANEVTGEFEIIAQIDTSKTEENDGF